MSTAVEEWTSVTNALGDMREVIRIPHSRGTSTGLFLVDGAGDSSCDDRSDWPASLTDVGAVVLRHDKPGCGGSPGHWRGQSLTDRARESPRVPRPHPGLRSASISSPPAYCR